MKETHVVLRTTGMRARGGLAGFSGPVSGPSAVEPGGIAVEVESFNRTEVSNLTRDRDVLAVAPDMPLTLIQPVTLRQSTAGSSAGERGLELIPVWGVVAVGADTCPFSGDGITVAVLDTGIDQEHAAFKSTKLVQEDFTAEGNGDQHGHGTHCAGTIFGGSVNGVRIGIAPGVKKALIGKVIGTQGASSGSLLRAIQWAVNEGANVISMSLGMDFPGFQKKLEERGFPPELATSRALEGYRANVLLFERLASTIHAMATFGQGTILLAAAGNESRTDINPDFKIAVSPPAVSEGIISVGALAQSDDLFVVAPFSNTGPVVAGPGVDITSAKRGGGLLSMSGTSMATPHVAGVAALWAEKLKSEGRLNPRLLTAQLIGNAVTNNFRPGFDPVDVGAGLIKAPQP